MDPDAGDELLILLIVYEVLVVILLVVLGLLGKHFGERDSSKREVKYDRKYHGLYASAMWPSFLRGTASLVVVLLGFMPASVFLTCFILGPILAATEEGWTAKQGILYVMSNVL